MSFTNISIVNTSLSSLVLLDETMTPNYSMSSGHGTYNTFTSLALNLSWQHVRL